MSDVRQIYTGVDDGKPRENTDYGGIEVKVHKPLLITVAPVIRKPVMWNTDIHKPLRFASDQPVTIGGISIPRVQIARHIKSSVSHVSKIFGGHVTPSLETFGRLCVAFKCPMEEMYNILLRVKYGNRSKSDRRRGKENSDGDTTE